MIQDWRLLPALAATWLSIWLLTGFFDQFVPLLLGSIMMWLAVALGCLHLLRRRRLARHREGTGQRWWQGESAFATGCLAALIAAGTLVICAPVLSARANFITEHTGTYLALSVKLEDSGKPASGSQQRFTAQLVPDSTHGIPSGTVWLYLPESTPATLRPQAGDTLHATFHIKPGWGNKLAELHTSAQLPHRVEESTSAAVSRRSELAAASAQFPDFSQGLIPGIAVGDDAALPTSWQTPLRTVSLTHITAVSGAHIALMVAIVTAATVWAPRLVQTAAALAAIGVLIWLVHGEPSVIRAAAMGVVVAVGRGLGRMGSGASALCVSAIVLLMIWPHLAREWGFALSLSATWGLIWLQPIVTNWLFPLPRMVAELLAIPIAAQLACLPLLVMLDPVIPLFSVPANVIAGLAVPTITITSLAATALLPSTGACTQALLWISHAGSAWIAAVAEFFAALPGANLPLAVGLAGLGGVVIVQRLRTGNNRAKT